MVGALRAGPRLTAHLLFSFLCTGIIGLASTLYNSFLPFLCVFVAPPGSSGFFFSLGVVAHSSVL